MCSFFHSSLMCTFSCHPSPPTILPSSLTLSCYLFLGLPLNLLFLNWYIIPFWELYFLPFSVHAQTNYLFDVLNTVQIQDFMSAWFLSLPLFMYISLVFSNTWFPSVK
jgi:hypothetical protein